MTLVNRFPAPFSSPLRLCLFSKAFNFDTGLYAGDCAYRLQNLEYRKSSRQNRGDITKLVTKINENNYSYDLKFAPPAENPLRTFFIPQMLVTGAITQDHQPGRTLVSGEVSLHFNWYVYAIGLVAFLMAVFFGLPADNEGAYGYLEASALVFCAGLLLLSVWSSYITRRDKLYRSLCRLLADDYHPVANA